MKAIFFPVPRHLGPKWKGVLIHFGHVQKKTKQGLAVTLRKSGEILGGTSCLWAQNSCKLGCFRHA